jgi:hypothetical protein
MDENHPTKFLPEPGPGPEKGDFADPFRKVTQQEKKN